MYLQQRSHQVEGDEDGCQGGVAPPQGVDGVEENEVTRGNQEEEHTGRTRVHSWKRQTFPHSAAVPLHDDTIRNMWSSGFDENFMRKA